MAGRGATALRQLDEPPVVFWQRFRHSWTYNHRLNRIGDWIAHRRRDRDRVEAVAAHSAASGSGKDAARYESYHTAVRARGVCFTEVKEPIRITSREEALQAFVREIRVPARSGSDAPVLAACINGFDVYSERDADKLISFHLAVSQPVLDRARGEIVCQLLGAMNVDCDSPECDMHGGVADFFGATILGGAAGGVIAQIVGGGTFALRAAGAAFGALFSKLKLATDYALEVQLVITEGQPGALVATASLHRNAFDWDKKTAIHRTSDGTLTTTLAGEPGDWPVAVPTVKQLSLVVTRERGLLKPDTAMHLLEWDMAVRPVSTTPDGCRVELDLFFRNWRERESAHLDDQIDPPIIKWIGPLDELSEDIASHGDAGTATATMAVELLQFAEAEATPQDTAAGSIFWKGGNRHSKSSEAVARTDLVFELAAPAPPEEPVVADTGALLVVLEQVL